MFEQLSYHKGYHDANQYQMKAETHVVDLRRSSYIPDVNRSEGTTKGDGHDGRSERGKLAIDYMN